MPRGSARRRAGKDDPEVSRREPDDGGNLHARVASAVEGVESQPRATRCPTAPDQGLTPDLSESEPRLFHSEVTDSPSDSDGPMRFELNAEWSVLDDRWRTTPTEQPTPSTHETRTPVKRLYSQTRHSSRAISAAAVRTRSSFSKTSRVETACQSRIRCRRSGPRAGGFEPGLRLQAERSLLCSLR